MITRVELKGVTSSKDKGSIRFAPITVLAGTNSPGKSSIFQTVLDDETDFRTPRIELPACS